MNEVHTEIACVASAHRRAMYPHSTDETFKCFFVYSWQLIRDLSVRVEHVVQSRGMPQTDKLERNPKIRGPTRNTAIILS